MTKYEKGNLNIIKQYLNQWQMQNVLRKENFSTSEAKTYSMRRKSHESKTSIDIPLVWRTAIWSHCEVNRNNIFECLAKYVCPSETILRSTYKRNLWLIGIIQGSTLWINSSNSSEVHSSKTIRGSRHYYHLVVDDNFDFLCIFTTKFCRSTCWQVVCTATVSCLRQWTDITDFSWY